MVMENIESQHVSISALMRISGLSRERIKKALVAVQPENERRGTPTYPLGQALRALVHGPESQGDRERRLRGDLLEQRLARMKAEQIDAARVKFVVSEVLIQLRQIVRTANIDADAKHRLGAFLKHELENIIERFDECKFDPADDDTKQKEDKDDQDD